MTRVKLLQDAPVEGVWHAKGMEFDVVESVDPRANTLQVSKGVSDRWLAMRPAWAAVVKAAAPSETGKQK